MYFLQQTLCLNWQLFPLFSQKYRHVDNIMFENHTIADRFLDFWRKTGSQRMGYLYGRYTEHKDIPLGIRAEVAAIYEPPQVSVFTFISIISPVLCSGVRYILTNLLFFPRMQLRTPWNCWRILKLQRWTKLRLNWAFARSVFLI